MSHKRPPRSHSSVTPAVERQVQEIHKRHPRLGVRGISKQLKEAGYEVDADDLEVYMIKKGIKTRRKQSWRHVASAYAWPPVGPAI